MNWHGFIIIFLSSGAASALDINQWISTCSASVQVNPTEIQNYRNNPLGYTTNDPTAMCVVKCVGQSAGGLDSTGRLIAGNLNQLFDPTRVQQVLSTCGQLVGSSDCQTGYLQWQCAFQQGGSGSNYNSYNSFNYYPGVSNQNPGYFNGYPNSVVYPNYNYYPNSGQANQAVQFPGNYLGKK